MRSVLHRICLAALLAPLLVPLLVRAGAPPDAGPAAATAPVPYTDLFIVRPRSGETLHDNSGHVRVQVAIEPVLQVHADHRLRVLLDGQLWPAAWVAPELNLRGVDRGTHALQVIVTDRDGAQLLASEPVQFTLRRASRLQPPPKLPPAK